MVAILLGTGFEESEALVPVIDCFTDLKKQKNEKVSIFVRSFRSYFFRILR